MTILDQISEVVSKSGAITLQGIYRELPSIKKTVIRGTINRYVKYREDKKFDRLKKGIYIAVINVSNNLELLTDRSRNKRKEIISFLKNKAQQIVKKGNYYTFFNKASGGENVAQLTFDTFFEEISLFNMESSEQVNSKALDEESSLSKNKFINKAVEICNSCLLEENDENVMNELQPFLNRIFNEDSRVFLPKLPSESIDLVVTDPPYKVTKRGLGSNTSSGGMLRKDLTCKGKIFEHNDIKPNEYIPELYRVLKEGTHCYIMTNHINLVEILNTSIASGFKFVKTLIWDKVNKIMGQFYMSQFEYIILLRKGKARRINNCGTSDIIQVANKKTKGSDGQNLHDTEKPARLMEILVENSSNENEVILDPFMGIGNLIKACKKLKRNVIGNELDATYWNICNDILNS